MPRVAKKDDTEEVVRKTPRRRTTRADDTETSTSPRAPRARTAKPRVNNEASSSTPSRKAPTSIERPVSSRRRLSIPSIITITIATLFVGTGVVIGLQDTGEIDVAKVIEERNERIARGELFEGEVAGVVSAPPDQNNNPFRSSANRSAENNNGSAEVEAVVNVADDSLSSETAAESDLIQENETSASDEAVAPSDVTDSAAQSQ
jgi:hypothetical protein